MRHIGLVIAIAGMVVGWLVAVRWPERICCNECTVVTYYNSAEKFCWNNGTTMITPSERYACQCWYLCDAPQVFGASQHCVPRQRMGIPGVAMMLISAISVLCLLPT